MGNTLYAYFASFIHFDYVTCNILTMVIPVLSLHFFSFAEISMCLYVYKYDIIFLAFMKL